MRIAVLSRNQRLYSTRRLLEAGRRRGHEMLVVDYLRCYMDITSRRPKVLYRGQPLEGLDAVIPRIGASQTFYGTAVVRQFEIRGVFTLADSRAIIRSRDKLRALQHLARAGVDLPKTAFANHPDDIDLLIDYVGGPPVVIKVLEGTQGHGVELARSRADAQAIIKEFRASRSEVLIQEFIANSAGTDIRVFVVGNRIVAAMTRTAPPGEFRSNVHRGARTEAIDLNRGQREVALRAAHTMGLRVAGVDLMMSERGPVVLEVNSSPGLEGIERTSGVNVAARVIEYIESHAKKRR